MSAPAYRVECFQAAVQRIPKRIRWSSWSGEKEFRAQEGRGGLNAVEVKCQTGGSCTDSSSGELHDPLTPLVECWSAQLIKSGQKVAGGVHMKLGVVYSLASQSRMHRAEGEARLAPEREACSGPTCQSSDADLKRIRLIPSNWTGPEQSPTIFKAIQ